MAELRLHKKNLAASDRDEFKISVRIRRVLFCYNYFFIFKYPYAFILNGCVGLIRTWLSSPQSESPEQVARLTYHLIENTIQGYLNMKK